MHRPPAINDALDILSSCYQELDEKLSKTSLSAPQAELQVICFPLEHIENAMAYLEKEYTI